MHSQVRDVVLSAFTPSQNGDKVDERSRSSGEAGIEPAYPCTPHQHSPKVSETDKNRRDNGPYGRTLSV